ncbi:Transcription factor spt20 [Puccinia graminis f. sp. tritici]|uniref:Transcription factor spt20 n=1 Tax=Puccinia graminis f. sp. tritici TaxID=56615 RepID=A0A5B0QIY9_PUCGR|nr:Transcription factor spt20 [Puccinia graminis f. sp. tritici]
MFRQPGIYNLTRTIRSILKRYRKESPSLTMHLYSAGFRLGAKDSTLHAYDGEMKHWMDCIREQKMPNELLDVLDELGIRFYDGCLIVEVHDHRSAQQQPEQTQSTTDHHHHHQSTTANPQQPPVAAHQRASNNLLHQNSNSHQPSTTTDLPNDQVSVHRLVLTPTCETLWRDILLMNEAKLAQLNRGTKGTSSSSSSEFKWGPITEEEAVELEAAILDRTAPALCLSPSIITSRIANQMLSETTLQPSTDKKKSRKRPLNSGEKEAMRRQRERQERYMHIADESYDQSFAPTFSRIDLIKRLRTTRPVITAPQEPEKKWNARDPNQDALKGFIPQMTVAPSDLHLPGYSLRDPKNESQQATKPVAGSSSHQPSNSGRPSTPPPASAAPSATTVPAPAPTGKKTASKKKAVERSETGSPAAGSLAPLKKPPKKPKKQVELTPEAAALAEEKRKKQAEQRKIQKERKLALAAAAKAEAAQKAAAAASSGSSAPTPSNRETSTAVAPPATENSIPVPNRDHPANQSTEYHHHQQADISISVPDSIPVVTGDSIPVPNQFASNNHLNSSIPVPNLPILSNHTSPAPNHGIPVQQDVNVNSSSIPVPAFNHSIPVPSPSHHNSIPVHQGIPVGNELLPMSAPDSIPVPSPGNDINCFPVPNQAHHPRMDQLASIPVPQSEPQLWNPAFANFRPPSNPNHLHQRAPDIDIDVHLRPSQPPAIPSLTSIEVPNIPIHPHALHQPLLTQQEHQQQQQQQYHHQQQAHQQHQHQQQHQQQQQQHQQPFHNWSN